MINIQAYPSHRTEFLSLPRLERGRELRRYLADVARSVNYFKHAGSSWNIKPRTISLTERFSETVCYAIIAAVSKENVPQEELARLYDAFIKSARRMKAAIYANR